MGRWVVTGLVGMGDGKLRRATVLLLPTAWASVSPRAFAPGGPAPAAHQLHVCVVVCVCLRL